MPKKQSKPADYLFWAVKQQTGNQLRNLILIYLADHMGKDGCFPSQTTIAERANCSRMSVSTHIKKLQDMGLVSIENRFKDRAKTSNKYTFPPMESDVNVVDIPSKSDLQGMQTSITGGSELGLHKTPIVKHPTKHPVKHTPIVPSAFDVFYDNYPKKSGRKEALKAWNKLAPSEALIIRIMRDIVNRVEQGHWCTGSGKQYIPGPAPYLNQERWTDEIIPNPDFKPSPEQQAQKTQKMLAEMDREQSWIG